MKKKPHTFINDYFLMHLENENNSITLNCILPYINPNILLCILMMMISVTHLK